MGTTYFSIIKLPDVIKSIKLHIKECLGLWRVILIIFLFQFVLSAILSFQLQDILEASIGRSLSLAKLENGFNFTVIQDFLNSDGGSFSAFMSQIIWLLVIYLIFASFISAGSIFLLAKNEQSISSFFQGGVKYFGRFFLLDFIFSILIVGFVGISGATIGYLFGIAPYQMDNEMIFLRYTLLIVTVLIFLISFMIIWKIKTKFNYINSDDSFWSAIKGGLVAFWRSKWSLLLITLLFFAVSILLTVVTYGLGYLPLFPMVILVNVVLLMKIWWRLVYYNVIGRS